MTTWKHAEREVAKRLGARRSGPTGEAQPDIVTDRLAVEVKHRKRLPAWILHALAQAEAGADGRLPLAVLHERGQRYDDALVIMRLSDFARILSL